MQVAIVYKTLNCFTHDSDLSICLPVTLYVCMCACTREYVFVSHLLSRRRFICWHIQERRCASLPSTDKIGWGVGMPPDLKCNCWKTFQRHEDHQKQTTELPCNSNGWSDTHHSPWHEASRANMWNLHASPDDDRQIQLLYVWSPSPWRNCSSHPCRCSG